MDVVRMTTPLWMRIAEAELAASVREVPGPDSNPRIVEYHSATSFKATDDRVPWCSSFVNWCLREAGIPGTRSAAARSWLTWGDPLETPEYGCIAVLARGTNPAQGHVGFYTDTKPDGHILVLGGNQADAVSIAAYAPARVLAYRWPHAA